MITDTIKVEFIEKIALLTVNRPQALNALNTLFFNDLNKILDELEKNTEIRVIVMTGEGKAFVAGADIAEMVSKTPQEGADFSQYGQKTFRRLELFRLPVIAAINGFCLGGGLELALACDFRFASMKAKFGQPEVNLGLIPGFAATQRLPRLIGPANALFLLTSAEMIDAQEALRYGLVQRVYEPEGLLPETLKIAQTIASKGPSAITKVKMVTRLASGLDFETGSNIESNEFGTLFGPGSEGEEGMKAFLEKRNPSWK